MITESILDIIGNTPMVSLKKLTGLNIFAKAEYLNPGGSIKDRVAKHMIEQAETKGLLKSGMTIMECTSGNTGIGIALSLIHISEPTRLGMISYAVSCLKKKNKK